MRLHRYHLLLPLSVWFIFGLTTPATAHADEKQPAIRLDVNATEAPRKILHAHLVIPAKPGPLTLYYPKWIPGNHGPSNPIGNLTGLKIRAGEHTIPWRRDDVDMFAFHCQVPDGAQSVSVSLDLLTGGNRGTAATDKMAMIRWNQMLLYPSGRPADEITFQASLRVPEGWKLGTALPIAAQDGSLTRFGPVSLDTLIDSPVLCGRYFREVSLGQPDGISHFLELACDSPAGLEITPTTKAHLEKLVIEAGELFGCRHYRSYRFLITLSNHMGVHGLEHHESSDDGLPERALADDQVGKLAGFLLPHEYVHSWNGKYRRPQGLCTPDFQKPMKTRLLWIYEGLTEYLGTVLTARSGLWTPQDTRDYLALTADKMETQRGRTWRPLSDTTLSAPMLAYAGAGAPSWRRGVDYYDEGLLIWLEVDTKIRQLTHGQRSIDDFCRKFYAGPSGKPELKPYTLDDVVATLNAIAPMDWKGLFDKRLNAVTEHAPLAGIEASGWRLAFADKPNNYEKAAQGARRFIDLASSIGLRLSPDGNVTDVIHGSSADRAGIGVGMKLLAVNSRHWTAQILNAAVAASKKPDSKLDLLLENDEFIRTYSLSYHGGLRYARLERIKGKPDVLKEILQPKQTASGKLDGKKVKFPTKGVAEGVKATISLLESCHSVDGETYTVADMKKAQHGDYVRFVFAKPITVTVLDKKIHVSELVFTQPLNTGVFWLRSGNKVVRCAKYESQKERRFEAWRRQAQPAD
jgi:predicted metalloprotease with PDZ domain